jgi:ubiquinone/menaquinone biosynthesis C-methylase UbiE
MQWKDHYWYGINCARERINELVRRAKPAYSVLDAGCNDGFLSQALIEAGFKVTSVDISDEAIAKAKEQFGIEVIKADVNKLPFEDNEFDVAIAGELLEHLPNPGMGLAELFRVSRDRVILSLPIGAYWLGCPEHLWQIDTTVIEHDQGIKDYLEKKIIVMEFKKR